MGQKIAGTSLGTATLTRTAATIHFVQAIILFLCLNFLPDPGEGDQFVFDSNTVIGRQMERTLDWLDAADVKTTVMCCAENGGQVKRKCGGAKTSVPRCKDICGKGK